MMQDQPTAFDNQPMSGERISGEFRNEQFRLKAMTISSEYKSYTEKVVDNYDFSQQYKITMKNTINANLDTNAMLARNDSIEMRVGYLELELNLNVLAMEASDTQNPGHATTTGSLMTAFRDFVSPSLGGKVRDRISIEESEHHASYSGLPANQMEQPRGFFNRGPGR